MCVCAYAWVLLHMGDGRCEMGKLRKKERKEIWNEESSVCVLVLQSFIIAREAVLLLFVRDPKTCWRVFLCVRIEAPAGVRLS